MELFCRREEETRRTRCEFESREPRSGRWCDQGAHAGAKGFKTRAEELRVGIKSYVKMMDENQNQTESVKMYRPWVGVLLSFFISGASQFLAGKKQNGIIWFLSLLLLTIGYAWCLASPNIPGDLPAFVLLSASIVLWIVMLFSFTFVVRQIG